MLQLLLDLQFKLKNVLQQLFFVVRASGIDIVAISIRIWFQAVSCT